ncbi:PilN domain-containing protein [Candidatus Microgenomates bacterium]|nr:PilN domain-containing protein [Candidatus Microgenomates bacterium]
MPVRKKSISLLPQDEFAASPLGRVLTWALGAGRVIVIITELAVILAFLSRFWLDRRLTDLNEQIDAKSHLVAASSNFENQFRSLQNRINLVAQKQNKDDLFKIVNNIVTLIPPEVKLTQLTVNQEDIQITGLGLSENGIARFLNKLNNAKLGEAKLTQLATGEQESGIKFSLVINTKH